MADERPKFSPLPEPHRDEVRRAAERICAALQASTGLLLMGLGTGTAPHVGAVLLLIGGSRGLVAWLRD